MARMSPVHKAIRERLETAFAARGGIKLIDGDVPEGSDVPMLPGPSGAVQPHACLYMDEPSEHPLGVGIDGPRNALGLLVFEILAVANDPLSVTLVRDVIDEALVGWVIPDGSEVSANGGIATAPGIKLSQPKRYARSLGYWASVGATSGVPA